jgi:hypothetical protein
MSTAVVCAPKSLSELFKVIPDPRKRRGVRHPFHALLTLAATAFISGARSLSAISEYGRNHVERAAELGFSRTDLPCVATFHHVFKKVDIDAFERALSAWMGLLHPMNSAHIHIDGKSLRGSARKSETCIHLLSAYCDAVSATVGQCAVGDKTNEHKASLEFLKILPLKGATVTGDAMFTHADVAQTVLNQGGDYFLFVKDNQKKLREELKEAFDGELFPPGMHGTRGEFAPSRKCRERSCALGDAPDRNSV